ncbi:hypothetical protein [Nocardioides sp.]|uniref:hypothetical protein n=1 Tax=Nocardioides sp. TaxID=35761 RepID=UPI0027345812|nr:hypothetical protein [Nocardioides sp.]MDP3890261.1 hypothetical protein [Nocardioides sp.]
MSPLSGTVLGAAGVVASPAMWAAVTGTLPLDVALTRYLIAAIGCWVALSVVVELVVPGGAAAADRSEDPSGGASEEHSGPESLDQPGGSPEGQGAVHGG